MARALLAPLVHALAWSSGFTLRRARAHPVARVLMLHAVGPGGLAAARLEALLRALTRHFQVRPLRELVAHAARGEPFTGREVALTFDDGQRCHAERVAPRLAAFGVSATFFVCPGLIESGRWIWNLEARARLRSLCAPARAEWLRALGAPAPEAGVEAAVAWLKTLGPPEREAALGRLAEATPAWRPTAAQADLLAPLTPAQVRGLDPRWIDVGSHTLTHPILPTLPAAALEAEVADSRRLLEAWLGRAVPHFCYPNGAQDARVRAVVARHYEAAVSTEPGALGPGTDPWRIPRVGVEARWATTAWRMVRP